MTAPAPFWRGFLVSAPWGRRSGGRAGRLADACAGESRRFFRTCCKLSNNFAFVAQFSPDLWTIFS